MQPPDEILLETALFTVVRHRYQTPGGRVVVRDSVRHPGAATVVPLLDDGRVCLIRNHRVPVGQTLIELPAGTLEPGQSPADTARRELLEETGFRCQTLQQIHEFFMSPGILNERMFLFEATGLTPGEPRREPGEEIENLVVTWQEALALVDAGEIRDAKSLVGLLLAARRRGM